MIKIDSIRLLQGWAAHGSRTAGQQKNKAITCWNGRWSTNSQHCQYSHLALVTTSILGMFTKYIFIFTFLSRTSTTNPPTSKQLVWLCSFYEPNLFWLMTRLPNLYGHLDHLMGSCRENWGLDSPTSNLTVIYFYLPSRGN